MLETQTTLEAPVLTVRDLALMMQKAVESAFDGEVWIRGELSNVGQPSRLGHLFFSLLGDGASLSCVWWHFARTVLAFPVQDGLEVEAFGRLTTDRARSQYVLRVKDMRPAGEGALLVMWRRLRETLAAEGLLSPARKRSLPRLPQRIGLITSARGAALGDVMKTLRGAPVTVLLGDAQVQGAGAPDSVVAALARLLAHRPDVVIVARGGGAKEELWTFNDERVVRAVAHCPIPTISAVGHEADVTLTDDVADLRASTPTQAAAFIAQAYARERGLLQALRAGLYQATADAVARRRTRHDERARRLDDAAASRVHGLGGALQPQSLALALQRPDLALARRGSALTDLAHRALAGARAGVQVQRDRVQEIALRRWAAATARAGGERRRLLALSVAALAARPALDRSRAAVAALAERLARSARDAAGRRAGELGMLEAKLSALSPLAVLGRGYAVVFHDRTVVRDAAALAPGDAVRVRLARGAFGAEVQTVEEDRDGDAADV